MRCRALQFTKKNEHGHINTARRVAISAKRCMYNYQEPGSVYNESFWPPRCRSSILTWSDAILIRDYYCALHQRRECSKSLAAGNLQREIMPRDGRAHRSKNQSLAFQRWTQHTRFDHESCIWMTQRDLIIYGNVTGHCTEIWLTPCVLIFNYILTYFHCGHA